MSILDYVPAGFILRDVQRDVLMQVERQWARNDVIVITAPTASGKSLISMTIAAWQEAQEHTTAIITPQVLLQDQYTGTFPEIPSLKGMARYSCHDEALETCEDRHNVDGKHCAECPYLACKSAVEVAPTGIFNLYSFMMSRIDKDVLVIDEAHSIISQMQEFYSLKIYEDEDHYPAHLKTQGDAVLWLTDYTAKLVVRKNALWLSRALWEPDDHRTFKKLSQKIKRFKGLIDGINRNPGHFFYEEKDEKVRGKLRSFLQIRPVTLAHVGPTLLNVRRHKIVLMSATIHPMDMEFIGLTNKRHTFIHCESPIPPENRPVIFRPVAMMSAKNMKEGSVKMCAELDKLLEEYPGKGLVHITYNMLPVFKKLLTNPRYMFHTKTNKLAVYNAFRASKEPRVLIACGMAEGIDLEGAEYEFQVIGKIQFPSLGDALVQRQKEAEPKAYAWQTIRTMVQQSGRICRTPTDKGTTIILDAAFRFLYFANKDLFPKYFIDSLIGIGGKR